jgi:hypothetical protein
LCYAWQRYRQLSDNLADALDFHMKQVEDATKAAAEQHFTKALATGQREAPRVGQVLLLYVDEALNDVTPFGSVRRQTFAILPKEALWTVGRRMCDKPVSQIELRWEAVDKLVARFKKHLRAAGHGSRLLQPRHSQPMACRPTLDEERLCAATATRATAAARNSREHHPRAMRSYRLEVGPDNSPTGLRGDRYEFWIYRQVRKRLAIGELYLNDRLRRRRFSDELVAMERKEQALQSLDIPWLRQPVDVELEALTAELHDLWQCFDRELRQVKASSNTWITIRSTRNCRGANSSSTRKRRCRPASTTSSWCAIRTPGTAKVRSMEPVSAFSFPPRRRDCASLRARSFSH